MPIFDYQCADCSHTFDALQKLSDPALVQCPACGKSSLRKLPSAPNFQLSGKGWRKPLAERKVAKTRKGHMFDSPRPHAEHGHQHDHDHSPRHAHSNDRDGNPHKH